MAALSTGHDFGLFHINYLKPKTMNPVPYQGGLSPEASEQVSNGLDILLADYHIYQQNLRKMQWNHNTRVFFNLEEQLSELYGSTDASTDIIAERILQLGYAPTSTVGEALVKSNIEALQEGFNNYNDLFMRVIQDTHALIQQVREVFQIASNYKDQQTIVLLGELGKFLNYNIWLFSSMRASLYN
jgi:starvation-inducible DNA-binding protein